MVAKWQGHAETARTAVLDGEGAHSFARLNEHAMAVATVLLAGRASLAGERVAIFVTPGAPFVEALFGVFLAGGCAVVLSPLHPAAESSYFCDDARVKTILCCAALREQVRGFEGSRHVVDIADLVKATHTTPVTTPKRGDAALQLYTSGTTGKPKGVVLTHDNLGAQQEILGDAWGFTPDDVLLHALPLHHMHGLCIALLTALGAGATTRMLPRFDATAVWDGMAEATAFMGVPTMYTRLFAAFDAADEGARARWIAVARSLRLATSGSAALPVTVGDRWRALTGEYPLERFGMSEVGAAISNPLSGERRPGSIGRPLPTFETRVVDEAGNDAASGELWICGPSVFNAYFERPDETAKSFVDDGARRWFRTGDTVSREPDGYIRVLGRTSVDILKSGGYKLSALEIEEVLREHPSVSEVAVVGVPDATWGERVVACVVARAGAEGQCTEALLRAFAKEKLAPYKVPRTVVNMTELPRNAMGKVVKPELARAIMAQEARDAQA